jgi:hypothetical protein
MKYTVDRIEEGIAVLISQNDPLIRLNVPAVLLPTGCGEGCVVSLAIERDDAETRRVGDRVVMLQEKLKKSG